MRKNFTVTDSRNPTLISISNKLEELLTRCNIDEDECIGDSLVLDQASNGANNTYTVYCHDNSLSITLDDERSNKITIGKYDHWVADITRSIAMHDKVKDVISSISLIFSYDMQDLEAIELRMKNPEDSPEKRILYDYIIDNIIEENEIYHIHRIDDDDCCNIFQQNIDVKSLNKLWDKLEDSKTQSAMLDMITNNGNHPESLAID